jgi:hypothetical protein
MHPTMRVDGEGPRVKPMTLRRRVQVRTRTLYGCQRFYHYAGNKPISGWLGSSAEEGRAKLRYAPGRRKEPLIRRCPNETSCRFGGDP